MIEKRKRPSRAKAKLPAEEKPIELTEKDQARLAVLKDRYKDKPKRARSTVASEGSNTTIQRADDQNLDLYYYEMFNAVGSRSPDFLNTFLNGIQKATAGKAGKLTAEQYNSMMAVLSAVQPENEVEALMAGQIIAANDGATKCMRLMQDADYLPQFQAYGNLANKFMRTEAALIESLAKLRRGGEQIVKHVHVHEGGQAVVADTVHAHGGRGLIGNTDGQSQGTGAASQCAALPSPDQTPDPLSVPGYAERAVSHAWRDESGGAQGQ